MGQRQLLPPLTVLAAALLACGGGCATGDTSKSTTAVKKPDVTREGVLPPPQATLNASPAPGGPVVQAGGAQPAPPAPAPAATPAPVVPAAAAAPAPSGLTLPKINLHPEKKVIATDMAVAWRNKIESLPDPTRNGAMGAGLAGQLFLFGGPKLEFVLADGVLTVDMIDDTPRPPGQTGASPERWQFSKEQLRKLRTVDDTFGKSYVLFLPWPAYRPDVTRVKISARYDPETGDTLFSPPANVTLTADAQVWDGTTTSTPHVIVPGMRPRPVNDVGTVPMGNSGPGPQPPPIPLGPSPGSAPPAGLFQPGTLPAGAFGLPNGPMPGTLPGVPGGPMPGAPTGTPGVPAASTGMMPMAPPAPAAPQAGEVFVPRP
jgi:hypothetical protein